MQKITLIDYILIIFEVFLFYFKSDIGVILTLMLRLVLLYLFTVAYTYGDQDELDASETARDRVMSFSNHRRLMRPVLRTIIRTPRMTNHLTSTNSARYPNFIMLRNSNSTNYEFTDFTANLRHSINTLSSVDIGLQLLNEVHNSGADIYFRMDRRHAISIPYQNIQEPVGIGLEHENGYARIAGSSAPVLLIGYNPSGFNRTIDNVPTPPYISLGHELSHAWQMVSGLMHFGGANHRELLKYTRNPSRALHDFIEAETVGFIKNFPFTENAIRKEFGWPLRLMYAGKTRKEIIKKYRYLLRKMQRENYYSQFFYEDSSGPDMDWDNFPPPDPDSGGGTGIGAY